MTSDNPYKAGIEHEKPQPDRNLSTQAAYNLVSDTVAGVNMRKSDNKFQAIAISVSVLLLATVGAVLTALNAQWDLPWYAGALIGAFAGLVIGFFASGTFLMIYRAIRHMQGKHE